jgi:uncharacterized protein YdiU (UPF0061 family)
MTPIPFDNSYARLPERFFTRLAPTPVERPGALRINRELADRLGVDARWLASSAGTEAIAGNRVPPGAEPIATVYAGHQFGSYNPQLGDGRAILLGEVVAGDGRRYDIQLKGSGPTPYSRGGDGRSPLGPVLREYIVSEAMHALGVPTTRALAAVTTGERVVRDSFQPGAVLARVASSHIRIGTFQFFAAQGDAQALRLLLDHVVARHYPEAAESDNPALAVLEGVLRRQARLVAQWQLLGFIHGVMNTDNMLLCGETIDYGPCAFMDDFHPQKVFSSIDHGGRYSYRNQPGIAHWNLACLAQALLPLLHEDQERAIELAQATIDDFPLLFTEAHREGMARKLGLARLEDEDEELVEQLFDLLAGHGLDFTLAFRHLHDLAAGDGDACPVSGLFDFPPAAGAWLDRWRARLRQDSLESAQRATIMAAANPAFIPRNHLVEEAIRAAEDAADFGPFHALVERVTRPLAYDPADRRYAQPPRPEQVVTRTFCGT